MNNLTSQTKRPSRSKNENAITLVALIITIIILIILAVVTINTLTHDGLADLAIKSTQDYQKAQSDEMNMLNEIDSMVKETLKNIEDGTTKPKPEEPTPPPDFTETIELVNNNIGASIDYQPTGGTYSTTIDGIEYSGTSKQDFKTADLTGGWKIWNIDDTHIYLVPENSTASTSKNLTLANHRGYNNGVTILDNICNSCWGNTGYKGIEARSMKLSDILKVTTVTNTGASRYGTTPYSYDFKYPYIWNQYEKTAGTDITKREKSYELTTSDALTSDISYGPTFTLWYNSNMNMSSAYKIPYGAQYQAMVTTPASSSFYWLSSRYVQSGTPSACNFGLQLVGSNGVSYNDLYLRSNGLPSSQNRSNAVRPLVQIPLTSCEITQNSDGSFHVAPRG